MMGEDMANQSRDRVQALLDANTHCSRVFNELFEKHGSNRITATEAEWSQQSDAFASRDAARAALMPTEQDAIRLMYEAYQRLKQLGWNDPIYCPKDGSTFDVIEPGSTGIHSCAYWGEWPTGGWWVDGEWPTRPVMYRVAEAEKAKLEALGRAFRDSAPGATGARAEMEGE